MFDFDLLIRCDRYQKTSVPIHRQKRSLPRRTYTMFRQIACGFLIIPFKLEHAKYPKGLTLALSGTQYAPRSGFSLLRTATSNQLCRIAAGCMFAHILTKHAVHTSLPAVASRAKILHDLDAIAYGEQQLFILGFWPASRHAERNKCI
jgi:hypothetical protein